MLHPKSVPPFLVGAKGDKRFLKSKRYDYNGIERQYHVKQKCKILPPLKKPNVDKEVPQFHSRFKKEYINGRLPFEIDYSAHPIKIKRLAWKREIQEIDLTELLPIIIGGLSDCNVKYANLADLAIAELMEHANRFQVYNALPFITETFKKAFYSKCKGNCMAALRTLRTIVTSLHLAGSILAVRYEDLLQPLNCKINKLKSVDDAVFYGQWKSEKLEDFIISTLHVLERFTDDLVDQVDIYGKIRSAIPTYESLESGKLATNMIRMKLAAFQDQNQSGFGAFSKQRKPGKYCLKKALRYETNKMLEDMLIPELNRPTIVISNEINNDRKGTLEAKFDAPPKRELIKHNRQKKPNKEKYSLLHLSKWPKYCPVDKSYRAHYRNIEKNIQRQPHLVTVKPLSRTKDKGPRYNIRLVDVKFL